MSPCIGLGVPMVALTTQDRMSDFIGRLGLQGQAVNSFDANAASQLYDKALYALEHGAEVRQAFARARASLREQTRSFHQGLEKLLGG